MHLVSVENDRAFCITIVNAMSELAFGGNGSAKSEWTTVCGKCSAPDSSLAQCG